MPLSDYIPNIIGAPTGYEGLLGADPTKKLEKQANLQGLLGVAASLAQGMSSQGPRRSALQNILGSLAGGFGATQQAYQQGLQQFGQQQQISQGKIAAEQAAYLRDAVAEVMKMPEVANDPAMVAALRADPINTLKLINENKIAANIYKTEQPTAIAPQVAAPLTPTQQAGLLTGETPKQELALPTVDVVAKKDPIQERLDELSRADQAALRMGKAGEKYIESNKIVRESLLKQQSMQNVAAYDFKDLTTSVAPELKPFVAQLQAQASTGQITPAELQKAIENIQNKSLDLLKTNQFANETAKDYAMSTFGTTDITKLTPLQRNNVLAFVNAPSAKDQATIANDAIRLKQETGQAGVVPSGRGQFISGGQQVGAKPTGAVKSVGQAAVVEAPAVVPGAGKVKEVVPLIEMSDRVIPPAKKQKLAEAQPATQALVSYSLDNISQQKKAAEELLNNPAYIKAITAKGLLSGKATSYLAEQPGTDAYNANQLMKNLQTRAFVSEIQKMRSASPTGGAVGNVTEKEMEGLSNIGASLKLGMSEQEFTRQLKKYISNADRALKEIPNQYSKTYRYAGEFDQYLGGGLPAGVTVEVAQ